MQLNNGPPPEFSGLLTVALLLLGGVIFVSAAVRDAPLSWLWR